MKIYTSIICLLLIASLKSLAQLTTLKSNIETLCKTKKATIGVALYDFKKGEILSLHGDEHLPMQSVFKFHIALTVLDEVEKGKLSLDKKIRITKKELLPNTWSPLRNKYPEGDIQLSIKELMSYMVSQSDNNVCDILLRQLGGTAIVDNYIHSLGINDFSFKANEEEQAKAWDVQFSNWTTPVDAIELLKMVYERKILSQEHYEFLWKIMIETSTCPQRIKGQLPQNVVVAHKTGTSDTNKEGVTAAINDIGIIKLPNGNSFAICVFVSNSSETMETNEKIIADIAKFAADYFSK